MNLTMKKQFSLVMSAFLVSLAFANPTLAIESKVTNKSSENISDNLLEKLHDADFSDAQITLLSESTLKLLSKTKKLKKLDSELVEQGELSEDPDTGEIVEFLEFKKGEVTTRSTGSLDMDLDVEAWEVDSDITGEKKLLIVASYNWNDTPNNRWTDAISLGWPESTGWYIPTDSDDDVDQFYANDYILEKAYPRDKEIRYSKTRRPDAAEPNAGVGHEIDLPGTVTALDFYGGMEQYVYFDENDSGKTNVKTVYGHSQASFTPAFTVFPAGLSVEPGNTISTEYAITTIKW
ncbi:hypothetical protein [Brevibacillus fortis]|uniref:Uncharacterized protein n=1 Tax=Brevibacillus fortis TaxID=2126352 RepID=A0A2P7VD59_9BACL|nr:hypothetical protein [Brevibacillus fortis]PSJ97153.1 hypothetical protein C7R93_08480 [Brevibacillus fortis]